MSERIPPELLHPEHRFFLDYVRSDGSAVRFFEHPPTALEAAADAPRSIDRSRQPLVALLRAYNERLGASPSTLSNIDALAEPETLCVLGGQQAGFLGGPLLTAYKIRAVVRTARRFSARIRRRVVPIFWLATEDHDFSEINRIRYLDAAGDVQTISFDWDGRGRPIEDLPITVDVRTAFDSAMELLPHDAESTRALLAPVRSDDYGTWHARIWSRLFADHGLIVIEPRTVRSLAGPFFAEALASTEAIRGALREASAELRADGYPPPMDPEQVGGLFALDDGRVRIDDPSRHAARAAEAPERYSPDAVLRPLLADALFPTLANVLGPSEIAYHALLRPLYRLFDRPQPLALPRLGYTVLDGRQASLLERCGLTVADLFAEGFDPAQATRDSASPELLARFAERKASVRAALEPLVSPLEQLDPGLPARWNQTADRIEQQLEQLEERAVRVDLARRGISLRELRRVLVEILPTGRPQERVLSLLHVAIRHGLRWILDLESSAKPGEYAHEVLTLGETDA